MFPLQGALVPSMARGTKIPHPMQHNQKKKKKEKEKAVHSGKLSSILEVDKFKIPDIPEKEAMGN